MSIADSSNSYEANPNITGNKSICPLPEHGMHKSEKILSIPYVSPKKRTGGVSALPGLLTWTKEMPCTADMYVTYLSIEPSCAPSISL